MMLADLTVRTFEPLVGTRFECRCPGVDAAIPCELREAAALPVNPGEDRPRPPFSLLFRAEIDGILPQQICALTHPDFPEPLELFLVPIGQADGGLLLEAVFN